MDWNNKDEVIEHYKAQNESLRNQRNKYICAGVEWEERFASETKRLRMIIDQSGSRGPPVMDRDNFQGLLIDLEGCIQVLAGYEQSKRDAIPLDYGVGLSGITGELAWVRDILRSNCDWLRKQGQKDA